MHAFMGHMTPPSFLSPDLWWDIVSSLTSFFWNSNVMETDWASSKFGESSGIGLLNLSYSLIFLKQSSFMRLSPVTREYSHDLMHQKNAIVRRSVTVDAKVADEVPMDACL